MDNLVRLDGPSFRFNRIEDISKLQASDYDLTDTTVIIVTNEFYPEQLMYEYSELVIKAGCRDCRFCGKNKDNWLYQFDFADFGMAFTGEDFVDSGTIASMEQIPDYFSGCKDKIQFYVDYRLRKVIHDIIIEAGYGVPVKYIGVSDQLALETGKFYNVISVEDYWYRIMDEAGEDFLYPPELFRTLLEC